MRTLVMEERLTAALQRPKRQIVDLGPTHAGGKFFFQPGQTYRHVKGGSGVYLCVDDRLRHSEYPIATMMECRQADARMRGRFEYAD